MAEQRKKLRLGELLVQQGLITQDQLRALRGAEIGFIFQDPMTSLNPVFTVGFQLMEPLREQLEGICLDAMRFLAEMVPAMTTLRASGLSLLDTVAQHPDAAVRVDQGRPRGEALTARRVVRLVGLADQVAAAHAPWSKPRMRRRAAATQA